MSESAGRVLLIPKGAYDGSATYSALDVVSYGHNSYVAKQATTGNLPTDTTYWQILTNVTADASPTSGSTNLVESGGVYSELALKANTADLGTAAAKDSTNAVTANSTDLVESGAVYSADKGIYEVMGQNGAKNVLGVTKEDLLALNTSGTWSGDSYTYRGATYACQFENGYLTQVTVTGTTGSSTSSLNLIGTGTFASNKYKGMRLTGCPSGGSGESYITVCQTSNNQDGTGYTGHNDGGEGSEIGTENYIRIYIRITKEYAITDALVFKPMIRLASDIDPTYQPYAETNQQLTSKTDGLWDNMMDNGAVNVLPFDLAKIKSRNTDGTWSGNVYTKNDVHFTVNDDGTVDVVTEATGASANAQFIYPTFHLGTGKSFIVSGCPENGGNNKYGFRITIGDSTTAVVNDYGSGATLLTDTDDYGARLLVWSGNIITTPITFKPMLSDPSLNLSYDDYVPYAKSNKELTENLTDFFNGNKGIADIFFVSTALNIYYTSDAVPSDYSNLSVQEMTDMAQGLYDLLKKIEDKTGTVNKIWIGKISIKNRKKSDGTEIGSGNGMGIFISNANYSSILSDNTKARISLTIFQYGQARIEQYGIMGPQFRCSRRGIVDSSDTSKSVLQCAGNYNTINSYIG